MLHTIVCLGGERVLDEASNALRRHPSQMHTVFDCVRTGMATTEPLSDFRDRMVASYLAEHGLVPPSTNLPQRTSLAVSLP